VRKHPLTFSKGDEAVLDYAKMRPFARGLTFLHATLDRRETGIGHWWKRRDANRRWRVIEVSDGLRVGVVKPKYLPSLNRSSAYAPLRRGTWHSGFSIGPPLGSFLKRSFLPRVWVLR